jgi:PHD/YefM family antitoxin component YafN of YafNO toxin-antitoxin module
VVAITRRGKAAGVLIGFQSQDDWIDDRLENDRRLLERVEAARRSPRSGRGVKLEDLED